MVVNGLDAKAAASVRSTDAMVVEHAWQALATVVDPEIPIVSIVELGIVRGVRLEGTTLVVEITPTYSGCPATEAIASAVDDALNARGISDQRIETTLAPVWTTDWIAPEAKRRLREFGIAPPHVVEARVDVASISPLRRIAQVACPRCTSTRTRLVSQFGSTACKAHYRCDDCLEPFDYFKSF
ncbi:MAG TPA: 1,2-phenylacetyl-CoA epoxidase subunit PaaD [Casimicrobiaceae bacterium]|jgi:ring-1,2-phenylacetyl-CoA epoxidase subunit PaaD